MFGIKGGRLGWLATASVLAAVLAAGCQATFSPIRSQGPAPAPPTSPFRHDLSQPTGWGPTVGEWLAASRAVARMGDSALAGQVIVAAYKGTAPPVSLVGRYHLGGVIVQGANIAGVPELRTAIRRLQAAAPSQWPLVVATDQEGGVVERVGAPMTSFPAFMSFGAARDPDLARAAARAAGEELRSVGFTMVFAPDADVTIGPADPTIGSRSAGGRAREVATEVVAATRGYRDSGIVPVLKHFPGHGSVTTDTHQALAVQPRSLAVLAHRDFVPFGAAVRAGAEAVMVGHIALSAVDPGVPADLSAPDIGLLRSRLGFEGLVSTDALNMGAISDTMSSGEAAVAALRAGADLLLMPADVGAAHAAIVAALRDGTLPHSRVVDAATRIAALMLHEQQRAVPGRSVVGSHARLSQQVSAEALTVVSGSCAGPYVGDTVTPEGSSAAVAAFAQAARAAGLAVGPGGTTVALLGYGAGPANADIVVSLDTPYVLAASTASVARFALYGADSEAMAALVAVLAGHATARGRLPVSVQGLDQQSSC
jgi:beta-N-acetylhexosaminidase